MSGIKGPGRVRLDAAGARTVDARPDLRIPADCFEHYTAIYESNLDWALSPSSRTP